MKLTGLYKFAFFVMFAFCSLMSNANHFCLKDSIPFEIKTSQNYAAAFATALEYLKHDSLNQGISLLNSGMNLKNQADHKDRLYDYADLELTQIITLLNTQTLPLEEQTLGGQFVKEMITNGKIAEQNNLDKRIDKYLRKHTKSIFVNRLKIYIYCLGKDPREFRKLVTKLDKLLEIDSTLAGLNLLKGEIVYYEGFYNEGLRHFSRVIDVMPDYAFVYNYRALCYNNLNLFDAAIEDLDKAIDLYPDYDIAYNNRGNTKTNLDLKREAISDYKKAIEINPNFEWPYYNISLAYKNLNKLDSALIYNQDALDLTPNNVLLYRDRGDIYFSKNDYDDAINNYTKCINLQPTAVYYARRGNAYYYSNKTEQAIQDFKSALYINNKFTYAVDRLGDCYRQQKEFITAIAYYDTTILLNPNDKYALVAKAMCYNDLDKNNDAKTWLIKALGIDSTYASALGNLGWVYYCLGNYDQCIYYSKKAINYERDAYYAMFNIALATLRQGKFEESKGLYKKYITYSNERKVTISKGAIEDLQKLIKQNILADQASYILKNIFEVMP
jgi:tetratricopeptide (TPR) repeat protein